MPEPKIPNQWTKEFETQLYQDWKTHGAYNFAWPQPKTNAKSQKQLPIFSIDTPPPYVNAPVHIGHVTTYSLMDMFARYKRMTGFSVLFPLGMDRNGLPIEVAAEKEFKTKLTTISREEALELCRKILERTSFASVESFLRCGISFNSWTVGTNPGEVYETDSPDYRSLTQDTFIDMWKQGLIYEDNRINNWCPGCQTTLADAEVAYEEKQTQFNTIIFTVKETGEKIHIATTRPELVCTCAMVVFNPQDQRYKHLNKKTAITPLFNKEVPIFSHTIADPTKGTGLVMMCGGGDLADIRFFREMGIRPIIAVTQDGTMNEHAGFLKGLYVKPARKKMIEELQQQGLLVEQQQFTHRSPICERSKDPIEFIAMPELYAKQIDHKKKMTAFAKKLRFFAPESRQLLLDWISSVSIDWPITRRRFYATEVPLWYCRSCKEVIVPPKGKYYQPWKQECPIKHCPRCNGTTFDGDSRVLDTWFDSSISPLYILKWSRDNTLYNAAKPCTLRPQGKDIVRTWLYYTILKCYHLTGKLVFSDVWINHHITDEQGHKMSKSIGNIINPKDVLDRFGAEPFRLWAVTEGNLERQDFKCSFERIDGAGKTIVKLWNVSRFISMFESPEIQPALEPIDLWILAETNRIITLTKESYENYNFHTPALEIKHFIWETFASHYIELAKNRAYNTEGKFTKNCQESALWTLHKVLDTILLLWAPVLPFITCKIFDALRTKNIHLEQFPSTIPIQTMNTPQEQTSSQEPTSNQALNQTPSQIPNIGVDELVALNTTIWKAKKDAKLSLKAPIKQLTLPEKFKQFEQDIKGTHGVETLNYGNEVNVQVL